MIQHGDVLLVPVAAPTAEQIESAQIAKHDARHGVIVVRGEATGHAHVVRGISGEITVLRVPGMQPALLHIPGGGVITHEHESTGAPAEHRPLRLPDEWYEVRVQREYVPARLPRRVVD